LGAVVSHAGDASWTFSGRPGGVSDGCYAALNLADHVGDDQDAVAENRSRLGAIVGVPVSNVAVMQAAHGSDAAVVTTGGVVPDVDILVTRTPGLALLALAADCATITLVDPQVGVIAAVHSGWRGVAANAAGAAVAALQEQGAHPEKIEAHIGPVICPGCYEVSTQVADEVAHAAPEARSKTRWNTPAVDLHAGIIQQLARQGVTRVCRDATCTAESDALFSYRAQRITGRHGAIIALATSPGTS